MNEKKTLTILDRINLTPYEQYKKYEIIPYGIIFHLILLLLTTSFLLTDSHQQNARFSRAEANEMWSKLLWSDIANIKERHQMNIERWKSNSYFISQRRILVEDVRNLMIEYFLLDKRTVDDWYVYSKKKEDTKKRENDDEYHGLVIDKPTYTVKRRNPEQQHNNNPEDGNMYDYDPGLTKYSIDVYPLENSNIPGPLGVYKIVNGTIVISSELEKWLDDVVTIDFDMAVATIVPRETHIMSNPTRKWKINVNYNCAITGTVVATLTASNVYYCSFDYDCTFFTFGSCLITACVTFACLYQTTIFFNLSYAMYILRRIRFEKKEQYQRLEIGDILNLINFLPALLASIGNILIIIFYLKVLTNAIMEKSYEPTDTTSSLLLGLAIACIWIDTTKYIRTESRYNTIFITLQQASIKIGFVLLGILPIFIAYAIFAYSYWGEINERFATLTSTCLTLFAVLNGDEIHPTYVSLESRWNGSNFYDSTFIEYCFMYSFIIFFTFIGARVCISIIEDIYLQDNLFRQKNNTKVKSSIGPILEKILHEFDLEESMHVRENNSSPSRRS